MLTRVLDVRKSKGRKAALDLAAHFIERGQLVVFPTETVYGLGANAFNAKAVKNIFLTKGRPSDNPLIVHLGNKKDIALVAKNIPSKAKKLIKAFWPGPLTLVLKRRKKIPAAVSAGLNTVAVRMPSHPIALTLIRKSFPLAAPSANLAGKPSATKAEHVKDDFKNKIPLILDGGKATIGVESTVLDLTKKTPLLLRPGKITIKQIEKVIGPIDVFVIKKGKKIVATSPGMKYRHYAPKAKVIIIKGNPQKVKAKIKNLQKKYKKKHVAILRKKTHKQTASLLFSFFRKCDKQGVKIILIEGMAEQGLGHALVNRVEKAATNILRV